MPLLNLSEPDKIFHGRTTRIDPPKIKVKKTSADTLKGFSVKPFAPIPRPREPRYVTGTAIPNSTVRNSLMQINTKSKDSLSKTNSQTKKEEVTKKSITDESSSSTIELTYDLANTSNSRILELRARHQKLLGSSSDTKNEKSIFEPRRPTMESIKEAIEKVKQLEINRHKNVGTSDDFSSVIMSEASTSTESRKRKKKKVVAALKLKRIDSSTSSSPRLNKTKPKKKKMVKNDNKAVKTAGNRKP